MRQGLRRWVVFGLALTLAGGAGAVAPYRIDLDAELGELAVELQSGGDRRHAWVRLISREASPLRCRAQFRNGPELPRERRLRVPAEGSAVALVPLRREVIRLRIALACEPITAPNQ